MATAKIEDADDCLSTLWRFVETTPMSEECEAIQKALTCVPRTSADFGGGGTAKPVRTFVLHPKGLWAPRFWEGLTRFPRSRPRGNMCDDARLRRARVGGGRQLKCTIEPRNKMQEEVIAAIMKSWDECSGAFLEAYCGAGKTKMTFMAWARHRMLTRDQHNGRLLVMVGGSAVEQWAIEAQKVFPGIKVAVMRADKITLFESAESEHVSDAEIDVPSRKRKSDSQEVDSDVEEETFPTSRKRKSESQDVLSDGVPSLASRMAARKRGPASTTPTSNRAPHKRARISNEDALAQCDILVASLHTVARGKSWPRPIELDFPYLCVDEAHDIAAKAMFEATRRLGLHRYTLGLSATTNRWDQMSHLLFQTLGPVVARPVREHPEFPVEGVFIVVKHDRFPKCRQRQFGGNETYRTDKMHDYLDNSKLRFIVDTRVIEHYVALGPTLVACDRTVHIEKLRAYVAEHHPEWKVAVLTGETKHDDRQLTEPVDLILSMFQIGKQANDWPFIENVLSIRPHSDLVQFIGRGRRITPTKQHIRFVYILDIENCPENERSMEAQRLFSMAQTQHDFIRRHESIGDGLAADKIYALDAKLQPIAFPLPIVKSKFKKPKPIGASSTSVDEDSNVGDFAMPELDFDLSDFS